MNVNMPQDLDVMEPLNLGFHDRVFWVTTVGTRTPRRLMGSFVSEKWIRDKVWQIKEGDVVYDIGAAFGSWTLPALTMGAVVYAFEPDKDCFFDLCTNVAFNLFDKCWPLNIAVGEAKGAVVYYPKMHSCNRTDADGELRLMMPIDYLAEPLQRLDWMKIDVEGAEVQVLKGGVETLKRLRPKLVIETHEQFIPGIAKDVADLLTSLDYRQTEAFDASVSLWEWGCLETRAEHETETAGRLGTA